MKQREAGFTLIEVLVALTVLAVAFSGITLMSSSTIRVDSYGRQQGAATMLAQAKLEELRALRRSASAWDPGSYSESGLLEDGSSGGGSYTREWLIEEDYNGRANLSRVTVSVFWQNGQVTLSSLYW